MPSLLNGPVGQDVDAFDFSRIFEDDTPASPAEVLSGAPTHTQHACSSLPQDLHLPPVSQGKDSVNLYLIVDPRTGEVVCPNQILSFNNGSTVSTAVIGPSFFGGVKDLLHQALAHQTTRKPLALPPHPAAGQPVLETFKTMGEPDNSLWSPYSPNTFVNAEAAPQVFPASDFAMNPPQNKNEQETQPLRALSAYNFFFQAERDRIINGCMEEDDDYSDSKKRRLLEQHRGRDRTKKRPHRKSHGRISFVELSREISKRWKKLPDTRKEFYRQVAAADLKRYHREVQAMAKPVHSHS